jgi:uncharacterized membrane protein YoaK (UPF0700 family)
MHANWTMVILGLALVVLGILVASRGDSGQRVGNTGVSVTGSIRQSISNVRLSAAGKRETKPHDWIGWTLGALGLIVGIWGLFKG